MRDFCSSGSAPPPAPMKTNFAETVWVLRRSTSSIVHAPTAVALAIQPDDALLVVHREARLRRELRHQQMRQRTVVDIGSGDDARRRDRLVRVAPLDDQRCPVGDLLAVLAVLHAVIAMVRRHRLVARAQEFDILLAPHEAHVRARVDEGARIGDRPLLDEMRPKLARQVELGVDLQRPGDVDAAIGTLRRIVQLAVRGMAGAGVVPRLRAFLRAVVQRLEHDDA